jgi:hypothetical protein
MPAVLMGAFAMFFFQHPNLPSVSAADEEADRALESGAGL